jgi:hypothetical protein
MFIRPYGKFFKLQSTSAPGAKVENGFVLKGAPE